MNSNVQCYDGLITAVYLSGVLQPNGCTGDPEQITYDAMVVNAQASVQVIGMKPKNRVSDGAKIVSAKPMHRCWVDVINGDVSLTVMERIKFKEACP